MELRTCHLLVCSLCCLIPVIFMNLHCPYPVCLCNRHAINCVGAFMKELPELSNETFHGTWTLDLRYQSITKIPTGSLPSSLTYIDFRYNPVKDISPNAFDESRATLETLLFFEAKFTSLPTALLNVNSLKTLSIKDTLITDWNLDVLKYLGKSLKELILHEVGLKVWPDWMKQFLVLRNLELRGDSISAMPDDALSHLKLQLENLTVKEANFTRIPKALSSLQHLKMLDMSKNQIEYINGLPNLSKLVWLNLGYNKISNISNAANELHPFENSLTELNLEHNYLTVLPSLKQMSKLTLIILAYNQISDPASGSFPPVAFNLRLGPNKFPSIPDAVSKVSSLTELWISYNEITGMGVHSYNIPVHLQLLSLYDNKITHLYDNSFPQDSSLESIYLDHNPLSTISLTAFKNLKHLRTLTMTYTNLTRMPVAISLLPNLCFLNLYANSRLICTCGESQIRGWFESRSFNNMSVTGRCGQDTFISNFFLELADKCPTRAPLAGSDVINSGTACIR